MPSNLHSARLVADDWGLSPGVNEGILQLAKQGLLRSVSVFANLPFLECKLTELLRTGVALAAHLNFTIGRPLSNAPSLVENSGTFLHFSRFLRHGFLRKLAQEEILNEASQQLRRLQGLCPISSLNGHEHVHLLPWMADPLCQAAKAHGIFRIREMIDPGHPPSWFGSRMARAKFEKAKFELEPTLYLWPTGQWAEAVLQKKLQRAESLLVHPAALDDFASLEFSDRLRLARVEEFLSLKEHLLEHQF